MPKPNQRMGALQQLGGLIILDFIRDLVAASPGDTFTRDQILALLDGVRTSPDLFLPLVVEAYELAVADVTSEPVGIAALEVAYESIN